MRYNLHSVQFKLEVCESRRVDKYNQARTSHHTERCRHPQPSCPMCLKSLSTPSTTADFISIPTGEISLDFHAKESTRYAVVRICPLCLGRPRWDRRRGSALFNDSVPFRYMGPLQFIFFPQMVVGSFQFGAILHKTVLYVGISVQT